MTIEADIVHYLSEETGVPEDALVATVDGDEVTLRATKWLDEGWSEIMDYVYAMDGEWIKDGKNSHWVFDVDMIDYRIEDQKLQEENKDLFDWIETLSKEDQDRLKEEVRAGGSKDETLRQKWDRVRNIKKRWKYFK